MSIIEEVFLGIFFIIIVTIAFALFFANRERTIAQKIEREREIAEAQELKKVAAKAQAEYIENKSNPGRGVMFPQNVELLASTSVEEGEFKINKTIYDAQELAEYIDMDKKDVYKLHKESNYPSGKKKNGKLTWTQEQADEFKEKIMSDDRFEVVE